MIPAAAVSVLLLLGMVDACGNVEGPGTSIANHTERGVPDGLTPTASGLAATRTGNQLRLVTYGSSSCPAYPTAIRAQGRDDVTVEIRRDYPDGRPCTADFGPTTSVITLPEEIDNTASLTVTVTDRNGNTAATLHIPVD